MFWLLVWARNGAVLCVYVDITTRVGDTFYYCEELGLGHLSRLAHLLNMEHLYALLATWRQVMDLL